MSATGESAPIAATPAGGFAIGIDVGGTKIAGGLVDLSTGAVSDASQIPSLASRPGEAVLADVAVLIRHLRDAARRDEVPLAGAGVAVAELVDWDGNIFSGHRIAWNGLRVQEILSDEIETHVESDVRAAALGEATFGGGRPFGHFIYVTIGTGISATLVQERKPYAGSRGAALVIANGATTFSCPACGATTRYVLEDFASGPAVAARYQAATGNAAESAELVLQAAQRGDAAAAEIVESAASALGGAVGLLVNSLDPAAVIVGGGLGSAPGPYWAELTRSIREHLWQDDIRDLPILQAELGSQAGVIGAAISAGSRIRLKGSLVANGRERLQQSSEMVQR
jgi:glucokinase